MSSYDDYAAAVLKNTKPYVAREKRGALQVANPDGKDDRIVWQTARIAALIGVLDWYRIQCEDLEKLGNGDSDYARRQLREDAGSRARQVMYGRR